MAMASSSTCVWRPATCCVSARARCIPRFSGLLLNGWAKAEWGTSENNRRARYYTLTASGRKQLASERAEFNRMVDAILQVLSDDLVARHDA